MHSLNPNNGRYVYHFNSDLSGDILVMDTKTGDQVAELPGRDFKAVVARWVEAEKISRIEQMTVDQILLS